MKTSSLGLCFSLRTTGTICAAIDIFFGVVTICSSIVALGFGVILSNFGGSDNEISNGSNTQILIADSNVPMKYPSEQTSDILVSVMATLLYMRSGLLLVQGVVTITLGSILVHGIRKESDSLLKVWSIFRMVILVVNGSSYIVKYWVDLSDPGMMIIDFLVIIYGVWLLFIVHHLRLDFSNKYREMDEDTNEKKNISFETI